MFPIYLFSKFPFSTTNSHLERTKTYLVYVENNVLKFAAEHLHVNKQARYSRIIREG